MKFLRQFFTLLGIAFASVSLHAAEGPTTTAATAINALGIDLLAKAGKQDENALLSPYSIQTALAMTYAGADGETRAEMAKVLHFPKDDAEVNGSFAELQKELLEIEQSTKKQVADSKQEGGPSKPITILIADRLFGQKGYEFRKPFLDLIKESYGAPLETLDFKRGADDARKHINNWVADKTRQRILDLIPGGGVNRDTQLVLVNAIYLKASWESEFNKDATRLAPFHVSENKTRDVPTMSGELYVGYLKCKGYTVINIPYVGSDLGFLILLPDHTNDLPALEHKLNARTLADCKNWKWQKVFIYLPKFKIEPVAMALSEDLQKLGMKSAFNIPKESANFDRMAPRKPDDYLCISQVFHKTFLTLDENGTEATAATAASMVAVSAIRESRPIEVHVDHPFLFAIQHKESGACIFLGRVANPN